MFLRVKRGGQWLAELVSLLAVLSVSHGRTLRVNDRPPSMPVRTKWPKIEITVVMIATPDDEFSAMN